MKTKKTKRTRLGLLCLYIVAVLIAGPAIDAQFTYKTVTIDTPDSGNNSEQVSFVPTVAGTATVTYRLEVDPFQGVARVSVVSNNYTLFSAVEILTPEDPNYPFASLQTNGSPTFEVSAGATYYLSGSGTIYNPNDMNMYPLGQGHFHASVTYPVAFDYTYSISNGMVTITGYTGPGGVVTIPSTINGLPVVDIGVWAFHNKYSLTNLTIPNSVTNIGDSAFDGCSSLTSVTIPDSVTSIGFRAFSGCSSLASVAIPNGLTSIGDSAFDDCYSLTNVTIPNSVTSIGDSAFYSCSSLAYVTIPNGVTSIGGSAFAWCSSLTSVAIPNSVTSIGDFAFGSCSSLTAIVVDELNSAYSSLDDVLFNKSQTTLIQFPAGKTGSYTVPKTVTSIGSAAFFSCTGLTNVAMPNGFTSIGESAFYSCSSLAYVTIPDSVTSIGDSAFDGCTGLTNVTIPNSVTSIGFGAFSGCSSLASVAIPNGLTNIAYAAFYSCSSLAYVTIPNSVTSIEDYAFDGCASLTNVTIPNGVTSIGSYAFHRCSSLTSVAIPNGLTGIADAAFFLCYRLTNVTIGSAVTNIGDYAFTACFSLASLYFYGDAPTIGVEVFSQDDSATVYYVPGRTGWDATFGGLPTDTWFLLTIAINNRVNFGERTNGFGFTISWAKNISLVVEACTNLANPTWSPVSTNILTGGSSDFSDPQWTNYPGRYYRFRAL